MGLLRDEMIRFMKVRGYSPKTIDLYTSAVSGLVRYFNKSPLHISSREIEDYFLTLREMKKADATMRLYYEALKFFYRTKGITDRVPYIRFKSERDRRPLILNTQEVAKILSGCRSLKYQAILILIYSSGLRISEALNLTQDDIDFQRKVVRVRSGKNGKDRQTILANGAALILKQYLSVYLPDSVLFYSTDRDTILSPDSVRRALKKILREQNITHLVTVHTLRHCFATHLVENGTSVFHVMNLLGHANIQTTMVYLHMRSPKSLGITSPLDASEGFESVISINHNDRFSLISA